MWLAGAAYGGYGSFLPMHQRSPLVRSDTKTPQISQSYNRPRSPNDIDLEVYANTTYARYEGEIYSGI